MIQQYCGQLRPPELPEGKLPDLLFLIFLKSKAYGKPLIFLPETSFIQTVECAQSPEFRPNRAVLPKQRI